MPSPRLSLKTTSYKYCRLHRLIPVWTTSPHFEIVEPTAMRNVKQNKLQQHSNALCVFWYSILGCLPRKTGSSVFYQKILCVIKTMKHIDRQQKSKNIYLCRNMEMTTIFTFQYKEIIQFNIGLFEPFLLIIFSTEEIVVGVYTAN